MGNLSRREFLHDSALLASVLAGVSGLSALSTAEQKPAGKRGSANDRLNVAVIGVRHRGLDHVKEIINPGHNCMITMICDLDEKQIGEAMRAVTKAQTKPPAYVKDYRRVLDDKSIDAIMIATPNHWHALSAVMAMQAGKHVYVEKPVSHNVAEGRRIVEAASKFKLICQAGTQSRSTEAIRQAMAFLHAGKLGKVKVARGLCYKQRDSIGKVNGPQPVPEGIDYNTWCGPAPLKPIMRQKFHYDWHWFWDYGNGDLGNQGAHEIDKARWGLNKSGLPNSVISIGGRFGYVDDGETANTQLCIFDYGDCELIFEVRGLKTDPYPVKGLPPLKKFRGTKVANIFHCEKGILVCGDYRSEAAALSHDGKVIEHFKGGGDHFANFFQAIRSGNPADLNGPILEGHISSALCHLANLSYQLGTLESSDTVAKALGNGEAGNTMKAMESHLKANKVKLEGKPYRLGRKLHLDSQREIIKGDMQANALLMRENRKGFEWPKI